MRQISVFTCVVLATAGTSFAEAGAGYRLYNVVPMYLGHEAEQAARCVEMFERTGEDSVLLETESSADTMKVWPHPFKLRALLSVDGPDALTLKFTETNTGKSAYESAFGVHPYFAVADACEVALDGERLPKPWVIKEFAVDGKTHELQDFAGKTAYSVMSSDNDTWCVWNPGIERTPLCETLGPDEWRRFYCLEPFMRRPRPLAPGESREHVVRISVSGRSL